MQIKKQFKKQNRIYIFSILTPIIVWLEYILYSWYRVGKVDNFVLYCIGSVTIITVTVLMLIHMVTSITFWKEVENTLERTNYYEQVNFKIGRLLVNEKFILDYGMFRKRVILIEGVFCAKNTNEHLVNGDRSIAFDVNNIVLLRKGAKQIRLSAPVDFLGKESKAITDAINDAIEGKKIQSDVKEFYKRYPCDFPFYCLLCVCIFPVMGLLVGLFPYIRDMFVDSQDKIKTLLFCISYEGNIRVIIIVLLYVFFAVMFTWKHFFMRISPGSIKTVIAFILIINCTPLVQFVLPREFAQYSDEYKEDYIAYNHNEFEMLELELYDAGEIASSSCLYDAKEIIERYDIDIRTVRPPDSIYAKDSLYMIDNDIEIRGGCIYQIKYLKNSRIIVEIQEIK